MSEPSYPHLRIVLATKRDGRQVPDRVVYVDTSRNAEVELHGWLDDSIHVTPGTFTDVELRMLCAVVVEPFVEPEKQVEESARAKASLIKTELHIDGAAIGSDAADAVLDGLLSSAGRARERSRAV